VTKLALPAPPAGAASAPWPLRATDVDRLGHVNNAVSWIPIEERWGERMRRAVVEYRRPIDLSDDVQIVADADGLWLIVEGEVRSAARVE
jgi:acyl-ACP thioesterase